MQRELDVRLESLTYTARFARPIFDLWGKGAQIIEPLYEALAPFGVTLGNIVVHSNVLNSADPVATVWVRGNSTVKFAFDRIEFSINALTPEFFESLPKMFDASTAWIKDQVPKFRFALHTFGYSCHAMVRNSTAKEVLDAINPRAITAAGLNMGSGSIFHNVVAANNWDTRILFDHSQGFPGGLFIALVIETKTEKLDYETTMTDGRNYFRSVLNELNLVLPEFSQ